MALPFLDANVFLRYFAGDHDAHSPRATALFERIERGELRVRTSDTVLFEVVFTLQTFYRQPRPAIRDGVLPIIDLAGIVLPGKRRFRRAFDLYVADKGLSFADGYHVALMEDLRLDTIISFDRRLDRIAGLTRIEP